jgi:glyoxylase-like metal-dependent hydrolase (beta-lactamase superfamily II)
MIKLRLTLAVMLSGIAVSACESPVMPGGAPDNTEKLADGLYAFVSGNHRSIFLVTDDGVIVTDPLNPDSAEAYRQAIARITDKPVRYVVYSHSHWDRISGGRAFQADGAQFLAQEKCAANLRVNPNPDVVPPDVTFSDHYQVSLGGKSLELFYFGPSHSDCLIVMLARPANMLMLVDLLHSPVASFPLDPTVPHVRPYNIVSYFSAVEHLAAERGVGAVIASFVNLTAPATGPVSVISDQRLFWATLIDTVRAANAEGNVGVDSFVKLDRVDLTPFKKYQGYDEAALSTIMRRFVSFEAMGR